jgi:hypothetical protein
MAVYLFQRSVTAVELAAAAEPEAVTDAVEAMIRGSLIEQFGEGRPGAIELGWLARIPGDPAAGTVLRFVAWSPGDAIPAGADELVCRGRRQV